MAGDTIYAATEVIDKSSVDRPDAGEVVFRHWGINQYRDDRLHRGPHCPAPPSDPSPQ